jgi:hypothetical protein
MASLAATTTASGLMDGPTMIRGRLVLLQFHGKSARREGVVFQTNSVSGRA